MNTVSRLSFFALILVRNSPHHTNARNRVMLATGRLFKRWHVRIAVLLGAILVLLPLPMDGQAVNAALLGTVLDSSGAVVGGANKWGKRHDHGDEDRIPARSFDKQQREL